MPATGDAPRATGVPESLVPGGETDSAGFPWAGRTFEHHGAAFSDDDGRPSESWWTAVLDVRRAAEDGGVAGLAEAHACAIETLARVRLLIPLLAEAGDFETAPDGRTVEKTQELSIVTVSAPDGRRVMPVFSSVETMRAWNPEARPIPVPAPQAAVAAAQEGTDLIIVDPGSPDHEFGVRRTQLRELALGGRPLPPWADPEVRAAFRSALSAEPAVLALDLAPGDPQARLLAPETEVILRLRPGLERDDLARLLEEAQRRWAAADVIAERVDSLRVVVR
nr:SseB family protein [Leucobacter weissii]